MPFVRPTLPELVDRIQADLVSRLMLTAPILRRSLVYVLARVLAGATHMLHGHLEFLGKQVFPDQSDGDFLVRQAAIFGISRKPAAFASGSLDVTGTNGAIIPAGSVILRADGVAYETEGEVTIAAGFASPTINAVAAGADGSCEAGVELSFESPIAGVEATAIVAAGGIVGGSDEESDDDLRTRLLERLREPPHGGSKADYIAWAKEVAGVTRAWCFPLELGAGTVVVRFVRDDDASLIPDAGEVATVQAHIDEVRPVTATVTVQAPIADALNYTISITPNTTAVRAAVEAELKDLLLRIAEPGGVIPRSQIEVAIGTADGVTDFEVTVPAADVVHGAGHMAVHGAITWA
jgi:uncharacterized phage protein gp47/JayE